MTASSGSESWHVAREFNRRWGRFNNGVSTSALCGTGKHKSMLPLIIRYHIRRFPLAGRAFAVKVNPG